jgi:hypothetical protein
MQRLRSISFLFFTGLILAFGFGCKPSGGTGGSTPPPSNAAAPKFTSVKKTSFDEVTSQLDPGGNFYMYLSTAQWVDGLSGKVSSLQSTFATMPQLKAEDRTNIDKVFGVVTSVIKDSGIEDATGVGISSIETEQGFYRNKLLLHHYPDKGQGFLWKIMGQSPHPLDGLNLLPANTGMAYFSDTDLPLLWSVLTNETAQSGLPHAQDRLRSFAANFEKQSQVKWDQFLNSLGGEMGLILTLDESNRVIFPTPKAPLEVPEPGLAIVLKVKDDTIFNRIDQELKKNQQVISVDKPGLKMRTMSVPLPLPFDFRPTAASSGGYLLIGSSDKLIEEIAAVQRGEKPGLKSTDEFKHLSRNIPDQGNQFAFVSERFGRAIRDIQDQVMKASASDKIAAAPSQWLQNVFSQRQSLCSYSVGANTDSGFLIVGNGTQNGANLALVPAAAVSGLIAAIAVPNFVKARSTSQMNACINNLRQLDAAKNQWALENHKSTDAVPTIIDLEPYLKKWPKCPAGGAYIIGAVSVSPKCTVPGHTLP